MIAKRSSRLSFAIASARSRRRIAWLYQSPWRLQLRDRDSGVPNPQPPDAGSRRCGRVGRPRIWRRCDASVVCQPGQKDCSARPAPATQRRVAGGRCARISRGGARGKCPPNMTKCEAGRRYTQPRRYLGAGTPCTYLRRQHVRGIVRLADSVQPDDASLRDSQTGGHGARVSRYACRATLAVGSARQATGSALAFRRFSPRPAIPTGTGRTADWLAPARSAALDNAWRARRVTCSAAARSFKPAPGVCG